MAQPEQPLEGSQGEAVPTLEASRAVYAALARHFDRTYTLPGRKGGNGKGLEYLSGGQVVARLNAVLGIDGWEFRIVASGSDPESVWVQGRMIVTLPSNLDDAPARKIVRDQFGECQIQRGIVIGDARKGAATDALKKCASLFGVGLYLSPGDDPVVSQAESVQSHRQEQRQSQQPQPQGQAQRQQGDRQPTPMVHPVEAQAKQARDPASIEFLQYVERARMAEEPVSITNLANALATAMKDPRKQAVFAGPRADFVRRTVKARADELGVVFEKPQGRQNSPEQPPAAVASPEARSPHNEPPDEPSELTDRDPYNDDDLPF
jgi:hypothetical protein